MNRGVRTALVLVIALVMATVASYGLYLAVQQLPIREVEVNSVPVVVATQDLPVGTMVTTAQVRIARWPASNPIEGAFAEVDAVNDRGLIASVVMNEPITEMKLASREAGAGLPPSIPLGMRAISVKVNEVIGVAGFVVPGTRGGRRRDGAATWQPGFDVQSGRQQRPGAHGRHPVRPRNRAVGGTDAVDRRHADGDAGRSGADRARPRSKASLC